MHRQSAPRRWLPAEENQLHHLRVVEHQTWAQIAQALDRTTPAVSLRWYQLQNAQSSSLQDWDSNMDEQIIDGRRRGQKSSEIAREMKLPTEAVQGRWAELLQQKKVPADVLAIRKRRGPVQWSEAEDEAIMQAWVNGHDEREIFQIVKLEGKHQGDVLNRRRLLVRERGAIYQRSMAGKIKFEP
ncbi:hypothetical protein C7974DRAFT_148270 [Boeremia exigua]|uniref:uncharacterized protein n=1 Tax=Boeremia exigua TaxID=749465 RepID=UPI001E8DAC8F|nr:uncharacterized protein C7974DRAFT_148270 [Boeremia exigua]KAH6637779.1 hypothetical protein C7974DRAFT_148270 [Boeremia exigua]